MRGGLHSRLNKLERAKTTGAGGAEGVIIFFKNAKHETNADETAGRRMVSADCYIKSEKAKNQTYDDVQEWLASQPQLQMIVWLPVQDRLEDVQMVKVGRDA